MDNSKTNPLICEEYNCRGLNDAKKRNDAFHWLKTERKSADIIVLTDTKCHKSVDKEIWAKEWSSEETDSIWSLGKGGSRGVAILITHKFKRREGELIHTESDSDGRYVKVIVKIGDSNYRILGIYAPNKKKDIFQEF